MNKVICEHHLTCNSKPIDQKDAACYGWPASKMKRVDPSWDNHIICTHFCNGYYPVKMVDMLDDIRIYRCTGCGADTPCNLTLIIPYNEQYEAPSRCPFFELKCKWELFGFNDIQEK